MKKITLLIAGSLLIIFNFSCNSDQTTTKLSEEISENYNPMYWIEGAYQPRESEEARSYESVKTIIDDVHEKGWHGILYWGASRDGAQMKYFYNSPFLKKQSWAGNEYDGLTPLVKAAHEKDLKVMVNMEGVNPYHWEKYQWTPENIKIVAEDLA
ncbi:MAG: hypothetical protein KAS71_12320, partial [Bacteroidales bacterium]|nr:hypothetical protein [Bacteroidales bacterium]